MASPKAKLQKLIEARDQLKLEMDVLRYRIEGMDMAIEVLGGPSEPADARPETKPSRTRRSNVKGTLLRLLEDAGDIGLNAQTAVELAATGGIDLDRGTVSSLLSRFKRDGVVDHDGERYRLKAPAMPRPQSTATQH